MEPPRWEDPMSNTTVSQSLLPFSSALTALVRDTGRCVVEVHSHRSRASGWFWRPHWVITASEPLADEAPIEVTLPGGDRVEATLQGRDASTDIALLRVDRANVAPASASADTVEAGSMVVAVGAAEGAPVAALGIVARAGAAWRSLRGGDMG